MGSGSLADAILIPSLLKNTAMSMAAGFSNVCGQSGFGTATGPIAAMAGKTLCCKYKVQENLVIVNSKIVEKIACLSRKFLTIELAK